VVFSPALPLGATTTTERADTPGDVHATVRGVLRDSLTLEVPYRGGWSITSPVSRTAIGDRSSAPRILSERLVEGTFMVTLEGRAGTTGRFRVREGEHWRGVEVAFPAAGANADGYTTTILSLSGAGAGGRMASPRVARAPFGRLPDRTQVDGYTIRNARGTSMHVINYGAIITSLRTRDAQGRFDDIVLGFDDLDGYLKESPYFGAIVGRYANRIAKGRFSLGGRTYQLPVNNGPNSLHGGTRGFDKVVWRATGFENDTAAGVVLTHVSPDGDMGYPGRMEVRVTYTLTDSDELIVDYHATTTRPTPVNLSQHSYFNLAGGGQRDILGHLLQLEASRYTPVDSTLIPTGELAPVAGTPFDFRTATAIGARIGESHQQLRFGGGYDHNFVLDRRGGGLQHAARVVEPQTGRTLDVFTDQPGLQFYSGNFLDGSIHGKAGRSYAHRYGFCLETQRFPDSPNQAAFPTTILRPGERYQSRTVFRFGTAE
jgi:aldose 1-epimerase